MYYSNEDIDKLEPMLKVPGGESYVRRTALAVGKILEKDPEQYKTFGIYWWAIKAALAKYYNDKGAWFMGGYADQLALNRSWHNSLFRTVLAGAYYHGQHREITSDCDWTDDDGNDHHYTLIDQDAGF
jgi:hypothetical protein